MADRFRAGKRLWSKADDAVLRRTYPHLTNTVIAQNAQLHQSNLISNTMQSSSTYQQTLRQVSEFFAAQGSPAVEAKAQAVGWVGQLIGRQATLLAYVDFFRYTAIATAVLVPLALLLRSPKPSPPEK